MFENLLITGTCIFSGFLTGLLGIGGGLVIVPMFLTILPAFGFHNYSIHEIVGISAACVFINSSVTVFYRRKEEFIKSKLFIQLAISIIIGTISGTYLSANAPKAAILLIYIGVSIISLYLMKRNLFCDLSKHHLTWVLYPIFAGIGAISSSIGIGGAVLFATALKCCVDCDTKKMLPTITMLVLVHALFAFGGKFALGFVPLKIIPIAFVSSVIGSKIGVIACKKLTTNMLNNALSAVMLIALIRVIVEYFHEII